MKETLIGQAMVFSAGALASLLTLLVISL